MILRYYWKHLKEKEKYFIYETTNYRIFVTDSGVDPYDMYSQYNYRQAFVVNPRLQISIERKKKNG